MRYMHIIIYNNIYYTLRRPPEITRQTGLKDIGETEGIYITKILNACN
jgi:hypothetical protein